MRLLCAVLLLLGASGCAPDDPASDDTASMPPSVGEPTPTSLGDTLRLASDARTLSERPTAPLRIDGACPFEGCVYGTWTTSAETTVYAAAGDTTSAAFTVPAGTALEASRGFVLLTQIGETVVLRPSELFLTPEVTSPIAEGDTLLLLDPAGEGSYRAWYGGNLGFSDAGGFQGPPGEGPSLRQITAPVTQWWAFITTPDGQTGWLWMDRTPDVEGADALSG